MNFENACFGFQISIFNNCDLSRFAYFVKTKELCAKTMRAFVSRHNYSRWPFPGILKVKMNESKIQIKQKVNLPFKIIVNLYQNSLTS